MIQIAQHCKGAAASKNSRQSTFGQCFRNFKHFFGHLLREVPLFFGILNMIVFLYQLHHLFRSKRSAKQRSILDKYWNIHNTVDGLIILSDFFPRDFSQHRFHHRWCAAYRMSAMRYSMLCKHHTMALAAGCNANHHWYAVLVLIQDRFNNFVVLLIGQCVKFT